MLSLWPSPDLGRTSSQFNSSQPRSPGAPRRSMCDSSTETARRSCIRVCVCGTQRVRWGSVCGGGVACSSRASFNSSPLTRRVHFTLAAIIAVYISMTRGRYLDYSVIISPPPPNQGGYYYKTYTMCSVPDGEIKL